MSPGANAGNIDLVVTIITGYGVPAQSERAFQVMKQVPITCDTASISFKADRMTVCALFGTARNLTSYTPEDESAGIIWTFGS
ncbi:uncharacterized protein N7500_000366 [Penicillium coprophilum]|uniref:uncharacterized protein n=1 Tax=Penicillium coprophilum TaxID=36646 RepID=UPI00238C08E7|nr:uncharacterized protein N7500_000366 [Penicillium coprophilum]KAJ5177667.1 hypothetical protein N7500_000366 [Penicillium coprophilum]